MLMPPEGRDWDLHAPMAAGNGALTPQRGAAVRTRDGRVGRRV